MKAHFRLTLGMPEGVLRDRELIEWVKRRTFGDEDAERMRRGNQPLGGEIEQTKANGMGSCGKRCAMSIILGAKVLMSPLMYVSLVRDGQWISPSQNPLRHVHVG